MIWADFSKYVLCFESLYLVFLLDMLSEIDFSISAGIGILQVEILLQLCFFAGQSSATKLYLREAYCNSFCLIRLNASNPPYISSILGCVLASVFQIQ